MPHKILIVDDEAANLRLLDKLFNQDFNVITATSGEEAILILEQHDVTLLITDQLAPGMTEIELLRHAAALRPHIVRIILTDYTDVGALVEAINSGQVYKYVTKPWNNVELRLTVERAIAHYETDKARHELALTNQRLVTRMKKMTQGFLLSVTDALEAKDEYTHGHAHRVSDYATAIGRRMKLHRRSGAQFDPAVVQAFSEVNTIIQVPSVINVDLSNVAPPATPGTLDVNYLSGKQQLTLDDARTQCSN